jgi:TolA-binding protein
MIKGTEEISGLSPDAIMQDADEAYQKEYYEEAIRLYRDFLVKFPDHDEAFLAQYMIGESYFMIGDYNKARIAYIATRDNYELEGDWPSKVETRIFEVMNIIAMEELYTI